MRVLVTGGAGFIGSHYVRSLLSGGYPAFEDAEVTVFDKLTYAGNLGQPRAGRRQPALPLRAGRHLRSAQVARRGRCPARRGRQLRRRDARRPLDRRRRGLRRDQRARRADAVRRLRCAHGIEPGRARRRPTRSTARSTTGSWTRGRTCSSRTRRTPRRRPAPTCSRAPMRETYGLNISITRCSNNYGPYQFPEKVIPLFVTNLHRRR